MASASASASASSIDDYKKLRSIVIEEKKKGQVSPDNLYKLAALVARWKSNDRLPVCLLCRDLTKKPAELGHVFPRSILKEADQKLWFDYSRGAERGVSNMGYYAFCENCEKLFQQGEVHFNPCFFSPFFRNPAQRFKVTVKNDNFPWLYYCLISIIWRTLCFILASYEHVPVLEYLRSYLLDWEKIDKKIDENVKLFLFAPNNEIDQKLAGKNVEKRFFYETFWATMMGNNYTQSTGHKDLFSQWLFCGPLHVLMIYTGDNFKFLEKTEEYVEWEKCSMLTTQTREFEIKDTETRFFPVRFYDEIVKALTDVFSLIILLPSAGKDSNESSPDFRVSLLHLLPKDVSYNSTSDEFTFNSEIFKVKGAVVRPSDSVTIVCVKRGRRDPENIIFVALKRGLKGGGAVAIGLNVNDDGTVQYMKGVRMPKNTNVDLTEPPFKQEIEKLISDLNIQQAFK